MASGSSEHNIIELSKPEEKRFTITQLNEYASHVHDTKTGLKVTFNVVRRDDSSKEKISKPHVEELKPEHLNVTGFSLSKQLPPVLDQGELGSCVSNATSVVLSVKNFQTTKKFFNSSRLFIYFNGRGMESITYDDPTYLTNDTGLYISDGLASVQKYGVIPETLYPYNIGNTYYLPSALCYTSAQSHVNKTQYKSVDKDTRGNLLSPSALLQNLKNVILAGNPVIFGINVYENFYDANSTGNVPYPGTGQLLGGHAIVLFGFDDNARKFNFRNSWGTSWGDHGNGLIPYDYVCDPNNAFEFYIVTNFS